MSKSKAQMSDPDVISAAAVKRLTDLAESHARKINALFDGLVLAIGIRVANRFSTSDTTRVAEVKVEVGSAEEHMVDRQLDSMFTQALIDINKFSIAERGGGYAVRLTLPNVHFLVVSVAGNHVAISAAVAIWLVTKCGFLAETDAAKLLEQAGGTRHYKRLRTSFDQ